MGYRLTNPEPLFRRINSKVFHMLYRSLFGVTLRKFPQVFYGGNPSSTRIDITAIGRSALIEPEVIYKAWSAGWRIAEVAIPYYPRTTGTPKGSNPLMILVTLKELLRFWWEQKKDHDLSALVCFFL